MPATGTTPPTTKKPYHRQGACAT